MVDKTLILSELMRYKNITSKATFARYLDVTPQNLSQWLKRNTFDINIIGNKFPEINKIWLMTGEGEMLKDAPSALPVATISNTSGIPFYDIDISASFVESFGDVHEDVSYYIDYPPLKDCNAAFPVFGDSMSPDFIAGEIIMVKRITNINAMLWGEPHLVVTNANCDNLRTIKNVHISNDRTSFILRATNPRYAGDTIIPCEDVLHIFLVKGKLSRRQL